MNQLLQAVNDPLHSVGKGPFEQKHPPCLWYQWCSSLRCLVTAVSWQIKPAAAEVKCGSGSSSLMMLLMNSLLATLSQDGYRRLFPWKAADYFQCELKELFVIGGVHRDPCVRLKSLLPSTHKGGTCWVLNHMSLNERNVWKWYTLLLLSASLTCTLQPWWILIRNDMSVSCLSV